MSATAVTESRSKRVNSSLLTVLVAFLANLLIAVAKSVAAVITSSASMVAEAAHSWADAGNEIFLLIADRRSDRGPDSRHPMGFGQEAYVWSMFAAFGLFTAGAVACSKGPPSSRQCFKPGGLLRSKVAVSRALC